MMTDPIVNRFGRFAMKSPRNAITTSIPSSSASGARPAVRTPGFRFPLAR